MTTQDTTEIGVDGTKIDSVPPPPTPHPDAGLMREMIALLKKDQKPAAKQDRGRNPKRDDPRDKAKARSRSPSSGKPKFAWDPDDCWHCKGKHRRETCEPWIKIMKAHNGNKARADWKPPPGYVSAKAKAYAAWKAQQKINGIDCETDDESSDEEGFTMACAVRTRKINAVAKEPPTVLKNSFNDLAEFNDDDPTDDAVAALGSWAHKVSTGGMSQKERKQIKVISTPKELDRFLAQHPGIAQVPTERRKMSKVMKIMTQHVEVGPGEQLVLMDSGSTVNVAKIAKHFPAYAHLVVPSKGSIKGETATTACGGILVNRGKVTISGTTNGQKVSIPFQDMDVELPIVSVRKCVKSGKDVRFNEEGGEMKDRATGKTIPIYNLEGTYYMKLKVDDPEHNALLLDKMKIPVFARPGR